MLWQIFRLFALLGVTAFGGPLGHIALMRREFVGRLGWISDEKFTELIGITNLIPGPNSTEMAIHLGYGRAGWRGCIAAGMGFILPAVMITLVIAWLYSEYGRLSEMQALLFGIKPAVFALILTAVLPLARVTLNAPTKIAGAALTFLLCFLGLHEILAMFAGGAFTLAIHIVRNVKARKMLVFPTPLLFIPLSEALGEKTVKLFAIFLKIGALLYGSGYVLFAFLDGELVKTGYLPREQLMDAIAVGQLTPGPVFSAVTFIGYQIGGNAAALISTVAVFLPSFVFVIATQRLLPRLKKSAVFNAFLAGINAASLSVIGYMMIGLTQATFTHWTSFVLGIAALVLFLVFKKLNSSLILAGAAAVGFVTVRSFGVAA